MSRHVQPVIMAKASHFLGLKNISRQACKFSVIHSPSINQKHAMPFFMILIPVVNYDYYPFSVSSLFIIISFQYFKEILSFLIKFFIGYVKSIKLRSLFMQNNATAMLPVTRPFISVIRCRFLFLFGNSCL